MLARGLVSEPALAGLTLQTYVRAVGWWLGDVRRFDNQLLAINERIVEAVVASGTTVTDIHGIGPLGAAIILGHTGDIARFPTSGHYARYTGTAPIAASSGPKQRHRLNLAATGS